MKKGVGFFGTHGGGGCQRRFDIIHQKSGYYVFMFLGFPNPKSFVYQNMLTNNIKPMSLMCFSRFLYFSLLFVFVYLYNAMIPTFCPYLFPPFWKTNWNKIYLTTFCSISYILWTERLSSLLEALRTYFGKLLINYWKLRGSNDI